jgi:IS30 family transposase
MCRGYPTDRGRGTTIRDRDTGRTQDQAHTPGRSARRSLCPVGRRRVDRSLLETAGRLASTLTWDQGNEMFHHERIEQSTGLQIYFADPHSPWQRGSNENTNGLLRQYFPKGTDLRTWTTQQLDQIAAELNDRPRQCLNDNTPHQMMRRWSRQFAPK